MRRIIFGLVMLWAALFGAWQASAQFNGCPAGFCNPPAVSSGTTPFDRDGTVQQTTGSGTTIAAPAYTSTHSSDVVLVDIVNNGGGFVSSISHSCAGLGTFTARSQVTGANFMEEWYAIASSPLSSCVLTAHMPSAAFSAITVIAISGGHTAAPFDSSVSLPNTNSTGGLAASCVTTNANDILLEQLETGTQNNSSGLAWIVTFQGFQQFGYLAETSAGTYATDTAFNGPSMCDAVIKGP